VIEVVPPIEDVRDGVVLLLIGGCQHLAAVALRRRRGAGVAELLRHGAVGEEGAASAAYGGEE